MKSLRIFIIITLITIAVIISTFIVLYIIWIGNNPNPLTHSDKVDALTGILALIIGSASALGSAVAALKVASLGLEISRQQERRDNLDFVDSKIEIATNIFSELAITLGDIYSSAVSVNNKIPHIKGNPMDYMENEIDDSLKSEVCQLADNIKHLCLLLKQIMMNDFARSCFYHSAQNKNLKCSMLNDLLKDIDPNPSKHTIYTLDINNLSDIISILDLSQRQIITGKLGKLIDTRLKTNSADTALFNCPYNNQSVRDFFFLGNIILNITSMDQNPVFIANYGAAILHDIYSVIPDGKIMKSILLKNYPDIFILMKNYDIDFCPQNIVSRYFKDAINEADKICNTYALVGNRKN